MAAIVQAFFDVRALIRADIKDNAQRQAIITYMAIGVDKCVDYGCRFTRFDGTRSTACRGFTTGCRWKSMRRCSSLY